MLRWFYNKFPLKMKATNLYGAVVTFTRAPLFYNQMGVVDTPEGRFEILVLHLFLIMERLRSFGDEGRMISQELVDKFIIDMDDNMREMGVGDLSVPRNVKKAAAAFYERVDVYRSALLDSNENTFSKALKAYVPIDTMYSPDLSALAKYAVHLHKSLSKQSSQTLYDYVLRETMELIELRN